MDLVLWRVSVFWQRHYCYCKDKKDKMAVSSLLFSNPCYEFACWLLTEINSIKDWKSGRNLTLQTRRADSVAHMVKNASCCFHTCLLFGLNLY